MKLVAFEKFCAVPEFSIRYWAKVGRLTPILKTDSDYMLFTEEQSREVKALMRKKQVTK